MSDEPKHTPYEWADKTFGNTSGVAPKYRDMLAMLASWMMGNTGAAQHFYARAVVDGASDEELDKLVKLAQASQLDIGDLNANVQQAVADIRAEREPPSDEERDSQANLN
jgi:hypothetical protein